jgi:nucleoside-diphosphate-sugar epimerase
MTARLIALTGATGFIGSNVLRVLLAQGFRLRALLRGARRPANGPSGDGRLEWIDGSLADARALETLVAGCDAVVHIAGAIRGAHYADFAAVNVDGTARLTRAVAAAAPAAHVLAISSLAARAPELSWYAASKHAAEQEISAAASRYTILRPPAVYGPDDPALAPVWRMLARGWLLRPGPARARFSLLHATDFAEAVARLVRHGPAGCVLTLHDGRSGGYDWSDVARIAAHHRGAPVRTMPVPAGLLTSAAALNLGLSRLAGRQPMLTPGKVRELSHPSWVCDNVAIRKILHWTPARRLEDELGTLPGWAGRGAQEKADEPHT